MTTEADIQAAIRLALGRMPAVRLWRNAMGDAWQGKVASHDGTVVTLIGASHVKFGIGLPGGSDLIGCRQVLVTPAMAGRVIAQFVAIEVKPPPPRRLKFEEGQEAFIAFVQQFGGVAGVARSAEDAERIIST